MAIPTLRERVGMVLSVLSGSAFRPSRSPAVNTKSAPMIWPEWRKGVPQWHMIDLMTYIQEGFDLNALIYSAIMYKVRAITQAPLRGYTGDIENPELLKPTAPLSVLTNRPNPHQSNIEFMQQAVVYLNVGGQCFTMLDRPRPKALPVGMYNLRPDRVFIIPGEKGGIKGYAYVPEGRGQEDAVFILPEDMIHVKLPNPGDPLEGMGYGLSPMSPLAQSADVDNKVTEFLKLFFDRGAMLQGILQFDIPIDPEIMAAIKTRWNEQYGGYQNWTEIGVLDQGAKYQRLSLNFTEMAFDKIDERNESRILGPFGVPPALIGAAAGMGQSTYSNVEEWRRQCWEDTLVPELLLFEVEYRWYLQDGDSFVMFDTSRVPALQKDLTKQIDGATKLFGIGVPRDQAMQIVGIRSEPTPFGDVSFLPSTFVLAEDVIDPPEPPAPILPLPNTPPLLPSGEEEEDQAEEADAAKMRPFPSVVKGWKPSAEDKELIWQKVNDLAESWEDRYGDAAIEAFKDDQRALLALMDGEKFRAWSNKASVSWTNVEQAWESYVGSQGEKGWREIFEPILRGLMVEQGEEWAAALGLQFDIRQLDAEEWFADYMLTFAQPINQTTLDTLHNMIEQALAEGWSIPTMQKHLGDVFQQWMNGDLSEDEFAWFNSRMPPYRTDMIARTETMRASNSGSHKLFSEWGVSKKEWLATPDGRTRDTHRQAGSQYGEGGAIPIDEPFMIGGYEMMYPGDASRGAPPDQFISCRCALLPIT